MGTTVPDIDLITSDAADVKQYLDDRISLSQGLAILTDIGIMNVINQISQREYAITPVNIAFWRENEAGLADLATIRPSAPSLDDIDVAVPVFEGQPVTPPDLIFDIGVIPEWNVTPPTFYFPDVPDVVWPILSATLPAEIDIVVPVAPTIELPPVPSLDGVSIPSAPVLNLPDFEYGTPPVMDITPPDPMFTWNEAEYDSDLLQEVRAKLTNDVINGGTGLGADVEQAIWDRALNRQSIENEKTYNEALNYWSSRGFELPPGALASRLLEIRCRIDQINEDLNNDILVQQSKLAQENTHFIITSAIEFEKMMMDYVNKRNQRLFEAAKYTVEAALLIYQAEIEAFKAQLECYKIYAEVYKTRIEAELAKVEIYKAQLEGAKLTVEVQQLMIEAYKAQLQGILAEIEVYKAEMEGVNIVAQINKTRIEAYKTQVDAYVAEIGAVTARFNAYQAQLAGETAKADVYESQSKAYVAQIEAYKARGELEVMAGELEVQQNKAEVETFKGYVDKYKADVERMVGQAEVIAKQQGYETALYDSETKLYGVDVDAKAKLYMGRVEQAKAIWDAQVKQAEVNVRNAMAAYEFDTDTLKTLAQVYAQIGSAAISVVSASAHIGYQESKSDSTSQNASASNADSHQSYNELSASVQRSNYSEEHIYHHSA